MISLTPRLEAVYNKLSPCNTIADIGCDHAYIPIRIIENNLASQVIATDLNKGPLEIAMSNIKKHGFEDRIKTRLGSGLKTLDKGEAQEIIIAGMGGEVIADIIDADKDTAIASTLILQPMNSQYEIRKYLVNNGFKITAEDIVTEGFKVYNIIVAGRGEGEKYENDFYYQLPPYLYSHKNFKPLYDKKMREFVKVVSGLEKSGDTGSEKFLKYKFFLEELKKI